MSTKLGWILLALLVLSSACHSPARSLPELPFGRWVVTELEGVAVGELERRPELRLGEDGTLDGFGGVNRFSGPLDLDELRAGRLVAGPLAATRMAGPQPAMEAEARLFALLGAPLEWQRVTGEVRLLRQGQVVARLNAAS